MIAVRLKTVFDAMKTAQVIQVISLSDFVVYFARLPLKRFGTN